MKMIFVLERTCCMQIRPILVDHLEILWQFVHVQGRAIKLPVSYFENRPKLEMNIILYKIGLVLYENDILCV